jgi:hypothetical protein
MDESTGQEDMRVQLELERAYVAGLPMPAAITPVVVSPDTTLMRMPEPTPFSLNACVGVELVDPRRDEVVVRVAPSGASPGPHVALDTGEARRWLIDLSGVIPAGTPTGDYRIVVSYVSLQGGASSEAATFTLREPDAAESEWLAYHAREALEAGSWGEWASEPSALAPGSPGGAPAPASFLAAARYIAFSQEPLEQMDEGVLSGIGGVASVEAETMLAELRRIRGDGAGYDSTKRSLLSRVPSIAWRFEEIEAGGDLLSNMR